MFTNEKKIVSAKRNNNYPEKLHAFIDKLLDSPEMDSKIADENYFSFPKKEERKNNIQEISGKTIFTGTTYLGSEHDISEEKSSANEGNDVEIFEDSCYDGLRTTSPVINEEKSLFEMFPPFQSKTKTKSTLSQLVRKDLKELLDSKLSQLMNDALLNSSN